LQRRQNCESAPPTVIPWREGLRRWLFGERSDVSNGSKLVRKRESDRRNEMIPVRAHSVAAISLALVTVLALLAVPICAPLCAARGCSSHASREQCHEMANMSANPGDQYVAPNKTCTAADFSAALVKADEQRADSAPTQINHSPETELESVSTGPGHSGAHRVPLESKPPSLRNAILRI
jgi:hypothetical protein